MEMREYENPWIYNNEPLASVPNDAQGFVYLLTCVLTGKKYIGKKNFYTHKYSVKTVTIKSGKNKGTKKKKKTKIPIETDWRDYYGSSVEFLQYIDTIGKPNIKRQILHICDSKGMMGYLEAKEQFVRDALIDEEYMNRWIMVRVRKDHLISRKKDDHDDESKEME